MYVSIIYSTRSIHFDLQKQHLKEFSINARLDRKNYQVKKVLDKLFFRIY